LINILRIEFEVEMKIIICEMGRAEMENVEMKVRE